MEVNIEEFVYNIFANPPKNKNEINIGFVDEMSVKELFEFLLMTFTNGTKILFGDEDGKVNLAMCTDKEYTLVKKYFESFGFKIELDIYDYETQAIIDFESMSYKNIDYDNNPNLNLQDLEFPLKCDKNIYVISFSFI